MSMEIVIFGATGMIGRGVLLEALDNSSIARVVSITRRPSGVEHEKLQEITHADFLNFNGIADQLNDLDACFWCLGISSAGLEEAAYTRITYDFTMAAAQVMHARNPDMVFCFVSGAGTDGTEQGRSMWARVKGKAENALKQVGFRKVVIFRPAFIQPMRGSTPRGTTYKIMYFIFGLFVPLLRRLGWATSTVEIGKAMIAAAQHKAPKQILDSSDINALAVSKQGNP